MSIAETNRSQILLSSESTWGETPSSPAMNILPFSGESIRHTKETRNTATIRSDAQRDGVKEVGVGELGDLNFELIFNDYDPLLEGVMRSSFTAETVTALTISFDAATQELRDSANGLGGFVVNQWVRVTGAYNSENNGIFRVTSVAAGALVLANGVSSLVDEAAGESVTVAGNYMRNGVTNKSHLVEKQFLDVTKYVYYPGVVMGTLNLNVTALEIITGTFGTQGKQGVPGDSSIAGSEVAASTNEQMTASANVGTILLDNTALTVPLRSVVVDINNNLRTRPQVGSKFTNDLGRGEFSVDGTVEAYFEDHTLYNKLVDHTAVQLSWRTTDVDGNVMVFTIPELYLNEGSPDATAQNDDVVLPLTFAARINKATNYGFTLQIDALSV